MRLYRKLAICLVVALPSGAIAQAWASAGDGRFTVLTASVEDEYHLPQAFEVLQRAERELLNGWGLALPQQVTLRVHPDLQSFIAAGAPWYAAGLADRKTQTVHLQRLRVVLERNTLE